MYWTGESGKGKTYHALSYAAAHYKNDEILFITFNDGFAHVRGGTLTNVKCLVIDELRSSDLKPA